MPEAKRIFQRINKPVVRDWFKAKLGGKKGFAIVNYHYVVAIASLILAGAPIAVSTVRELITSEETWVGGRLVDFLHRLGDKGLLSIRRYGKAYIWEPTEVLAKVIREFKKVVGI